MEEAEGVLSFDFEGGLDAIPVNSNHSMSSINLDSSSAAVIAGGSSLPGTASDPYAINVAGRRSFRQTVCRHWLRGLCMKGEACGFLHQYDKSRMPICRFFRLFGECREQDCVYKHSNEDIKECNMYKLGFCPNGPDCRYRHAKLHGPPPTVEEALQKIQSLVSFNYNVNNRFPPNRNSGFIQPSEKSQFPQIVIGADQNFVPKLSTTELTTEQQQESQQTMQPIGNAQAQIISNDQLQESRMAFPLPQGISRYFIVKSCNRENLELSVQQGVWATQRSNEAKLNEAFDCVDNVILIFSINRTRHFQGCAKMTSKIGGYVGGGNWKYAHGTAHYGRNFRVKWCKLCELSFIKTRHLRNPYNENLPVKISRDCQEIEPSIGEQLAALLYLEPDSDLMGIARAAESKRDEEREKGLDEINERGDPDIVPFEDNEEEEDEESEEDEEEDEAVAAVTAAGILMGAGILGRGRGRGLLWPLQMQLPPGTRPGIHGYPYDAFPVLPDQYGASAPRHFGPYAPPRIPGTADLASAATGVMFQGRPLQAAAAVFPPAGFGMMVGPMRPAPFMGAMAPARVGPGFPPLHFLQHPAQGGGWGGRRDQVPGWNNDGPPEKEGCREEVRDGEMEDPTRTRHEDSETEDEAPRRSRHVDGKKKR